MKQTFIFDIDGVLTDPYTKKPHPYIIETIAHELNQNRSVAIATGRAAAWVLRHVVPLLTDKLAEQILLDLLFVSCEKGGVELTFFDGQPSIEIDTSLASVNALREHVIPLVDADTGLFLDEDKLTMVSVEITGGNDTEQIAKEKAALQALEHSIQARILPNNPDVVIDIAPIALDLQHKKITKRISATAYLQFLAEELVEVENFVMFGDSESDSLVCEELLKEGKKVAFAYTGPKPLTKKFPFPVIRARHGEIYDKAAVAILKEIAIACI